MKFFDYTKLSFSALVEKIGKSRYFDLPAMLEEVLKRLQIMISEGGGITTLSGDFVNNTDPLNPTLDKGYKVYTALLTQSGTNAPVATVLKNDGINISWSRISVGNYKGACSDIIDVNKVSVILGGISVSGDISIGSISQLVTEVGAVKVGTFKTIGTAEDSKLNNTAIEIRVYN